MEKQSFEAALKELETIVEKLENGDLPLDEAVKEYEAGMKLSKHCRQLLDKAETVLASVVNEHGDSEPLDDPNTED